MKPVIDAVLGFIRLTLTHQQSIPFFSPKKAKLIDFVDRCCCSYTPLLLSVLMLITGSVDMYGKPINCWMPAEYTGLRAPSKKSKWSVRENNGKAKLTKSEKNIEKPKLFISYSQKVGSTSCSNTATSLAPT